MGTCAALDKLSYRAGNSFMTMRQRGAIGVMLAMLIVVVIGFVAMALDLARIYNRKADLQSIADMSALTAAKELNGTTAGITAAVMQARGSAFTSHTRYDRDWVDLPESAIRFSATPSDDNAWVDAATAKASPTNIAYVKVDTSMMDASYGEVQMALIQVVAPTLTTVNLHSVTVAGHSSLNITPIAVCALSNTPANARGNPGTPPLVELEEYGFRRGVSYDLMQLNPGGSTPLNFVVNPVDPIGATGYLSNLAPSVVSPFVCTGKILMPRIIGGQINVGYPFPMASLYDQLNSRLDLYVGSVCDPLSAPPDKNVKTFEPTVTAWMSPSTTEQVAHTFADTKLWNVAGPLPAPTGTTAANFGPLWINARAVQFSAYSSSAPEPTNGYATFAASNWATLYNPGKPVALSAYPTSGTPANNSSSYSKSPSHLGIKGRRILNVPLLACPLSTASNMKATVLGIGKFYMTVPATATSLPVEFAGMTTEMAVSGRKELYP